ncbi:MAG TPA: DNA-binding protein [Terriglobia bacterium]|nr:DNA-binding protein [Terriglobia bacterium]
MSKYPKILALAVLAAGVVPVAAFAQGRSGAGRALPMYNPATELTVQGTVQEVKQFTGPRGMIGTDVVVKTGNETVDVRLGPAAFLTQNQFALVQGDQIQVTGSKVNINSTDIVLAREVKKGEQTLTLRNAQGFPVWSRRGRR